MLARCLDSAIIENKFIHYTLALHLYLNSLAYEEEKRQKSFRTHSIKPQLYAFYWRVPESDTGITSKFHEKFVYAGTIVCVLLAMPITI